MSEGTAVPQGYSKTISTRFHLTPTEEHSVHAGTQRPLQEMDSKISNLFALSEGAEQDGLRWRLARTDTGTTPAHSIGDSEYSLQLTKAYLDESLTVMYDKIGQKFQSELHKSTNTLSLEIAALGNRTDLLETKHDELSLVYSDLRKDHESLSKTVLKLQAHLEDLDNRNRRSNLRVQGIPETVTLPTVQTLFQSLLPDSPLSVFTCDRIHRALCPKPPERKTLWVL